MHNVWVMGRMPGVGWFMWEGCALESSAISYRHILAALGLTVWRICILPLALLYFLLCIFSCSIGCSKLAA